MPIRCHVSTGTAHLDLIELSDLFTNLPHGNYLRYTLVRDATGALEFQLTEFHAVFDEAMKAIFGPPVDQPTVRSFKLDPETALLRYA
jgi:hypothetical protein